MTRTLILVAALATGFALPAIAGEVSHPAQHSLFTEAQARQHLMHLGYTNVSALDKNADGQWVGTALKEGQTRVVAVDIKGPTRSAPASTN